MELSEPSKRRNALFRRSSINLGELAVETIAVLLGVLIALAIDGWHEAREDGRTVASASRFIAAELRENAARLREQAAQMQANGDAITRSNPANADDRPCSGYAGWKGAQPPMLNDTAYQVAIATQAFAKMPYAQATRIGESYGYQRYVAGMYQKVVDLLLDPDPASVRMCAGVHGEASRAGLQLAQRLDATAAALAGPQETPTP